MVNSSKGFDTERPSRRILNCVSSKSLSNFLARGRISCFVRNSCAIVTLRVFWVKSWNLIFKVRVCPLKSDFSSRRINSVVTWYSSMMTAI